MVSSTKSFVCGSTTYTNPDPASIAARAGVLRGQFQAQGISSTSPDMLIAATAQEHQLVLVTRDVRGFTGFGVQVMNPFSMPA